VVLHRQSWRLPVSMVAANADEVEVRTCSNAPPGRAVQGPCTPWRSRLKRSYEDPSLPFRAPEEQLRLYPRQSVSKQIRGGRAYPAIGSSLDRPIGPLTSDGSAQGGITRANRSNRGAPGMATDLAFALAGLGGFNTHGAGFLTAARLGRHSSRYGDRDQRTDHRPRRVASWHRPEEPSHRSQSSRGSFGNANVGCDR
jgi:hypothetical protein